MRPELCFVPAVHTHFHTPATTVLPKCASDSEALTALGVSSSYLVRKGLRLQKDISRDIRTTAGVLPVIMTCSCMLKISEFLLFSHDLARAKIMFVQSCLSLLALKGSMSLSAPRQCYLCVYVCVCVLRKRSNPPITMDN